MRTPILAVLMSLLAACPISNASSNQEPVTSGHDHVLEYIENQAAALNTVTLDGYLKLVSVKKTSDRPAAYLVTYETSNKNWLTLPGADNYEYNLKITEEWVRYFCSDKIKAVARDLKISMLAGTIIDQQGKRHSSTACY